MNMDKEQNIQLSGSLTNMNVLSENIRSALEPVTILIFVEASVGIVANIIILLVYWRKYPKCGFRVFVLFLAAYDLISCFTTLPLEAISQLHWYSLLNQWECKAKCFFNVFTTLGSGQTLFLIALDRYRKICGSFNQQVRTSCKIKQCTCTVIISFISSFPVVFMWGQKLKLITYNGGTVEVLVCDEMSSETWLPFIYLLCTFLLPIGILMLISMLMNILVLKKVFCNFNGRITSSTSFMLKRQTVRNCNNGPTIQKYMCSAETNVPVNCFHVPCSSVPNQMYKYVEERRLSKKDCVEKWRQSSVIYEDFECSLGNQNLGRQTNCEMLTKSDILNRFSAEFEICKKRTSQILTEGKGKNHDQVTDCESMEMHGNAQCKDKSADEHSSNSECEIIHLLKDERQNGGETEEAGTGEVGPKFSLNQDAGILTDISLDITFDCSSQASCVVEDVTLARAKRKTLIMFILTSLFVVTLIAYLVLLSTIAKTDGFLLDLDSTETLLVFFFLRLYFLNSIVNVVLYGFLDRRFKSGIQSLICDFKTLLAACK